MLLLLLPTILYISRYGTEFPYNDVELQDTDLKLPRKSTKSSLDNVKYINEVNSLIDVSNPSIFKKIETKHQHLLEYLDFPSRVAPYDFSNCRMSNCFNLSRCLAPGPIKIHIKSSEWIPMNNSGENNIIHRSILKIIRESVHYEADSDKACLFVPEEDTLDRDPLSPSFTSNINYLFGPKHNYGMNYLIFNLYSGSWPDYKENDFGGLQVNAAILAKASASLKYHRPEYDISLALFSHLHPVAQQPMLRINRNTNFSNKTYFLSFKGKRYVFGSGSETRNSLYHLHNDNDIIMLSTCKHGKKWQDSIDDRCSLDEDNYNRYDFEDLMKKSTFCLVPRGRRLGSYRFIEALQFGCIPVILSNGWVKPHENLIDWDQACIQFDERLTLLVPDLLRDLDEKSINILKTNGKILYRRYLSTVERIVLTTVDIIQKRITRLR